MTVRLMLPIALTLAISACAPTPPAGGTPPPPHAGTCDAEAARWAIGQAATPDVVERIRVDTGSRTARVIGPDDMVTMDYRPDRVNVKTNERGAITEVTCG
ncbi:I78 family peptidase inhibitor [Luteimonas pelagia]